MTESAFQALKGATEDFETGLPIIPSGEFASFAPYAKHSTRSARVRKLPVLRAEFDASRFDLAAADTYCGYGAVQVGDSVALAFRIQRGPDALYWLANPADAEVWKAIDQWVAAKRMVLAAEFGEQVLIMVRDFHEPPPMRLLRRAVQLEKRVTPVFAATMSSCNTKV